MPRNRRYSSTSATISIAVPHDADNHGGGWKSPAGGSGQYGYRRFGDEVVVIHRTGGKEYRQTIRLTFTPTNFSGKRAWFACPQCYRRVGRLFWPVYGGWAFRCRHCWRLRYYTQRLTPEWRARERAEKIMKRLGGGSNLMLDVFPDKPKWMRWATYNHWFEKYDAAYGQYDDLSMQSLVRLCIRHGWL
jgi:hypothetical protein